MISIKSNREIELMKHAGYINYLTHEEVKYLIKDIDKEKQEEIFNLMVDNYDGYLFNKNINERVFNATLVMYFLKNYYDFNTVPEELLDTNIAFNYGKIENLLKLQTASYSGGKALRNRVFSHGCFQTLYPQPQRMHKNHSLYR